MSQDAVIPNQTPVGISDTVRKVLIENARTVEPTPTFDETPVITVPNPNYPGSPASTAEERKAAGYPDITLTIEDIKSNATKVAEAIAQHRQEERTPSVLDQLPE